MQLAFIYSPNYLLLLTFHIKNVDSPDDTTGG